MDHRDKPLDSDGDCGPDGAIEGDVDERQQPREEVGVDPLLGCQKLSGYAESPFILRIRPTQLFQASATVRHCLTIFKVKIQVDH